MSINPQSPPFVFLNWDQKKQKYEGRGGMEIQLIETLGDYFNFSYEIINCNNHWGNLLPNNKWNGIIGELSTEQADLGVGGITLTYDRSKAVPYLYPHVVTSVTFITPAPSTAPNLYLAFKPLSFDVWMGFLMSLLICALFDLLYNWVHRDYGSYVKIFWLSMYSMFRQQCSSSGRETSSMNTWMFFWSTAAFVLTTGYAGCLCSLITIPQKMKTLDTVLELADAVKAGKNSQLTLYRELGKVLTPVKSKTEGFEMVIKNKKPHAFVSMRESLRYGQLSYGEDQIYITPEGQSSALIARMISVGLINRWKEYEYLKLQLSNPKRNEEAANADKR
ncbi:hypothetical protein TYRP_004669 [Tyrophagus putrescentiae]|nr:hypothetical protein TYRP_004669 [Tyrophagus putrescentiae]